MNDFLLITENHQLQQWCDSVAADKQLALDTEFIREKTYWPRLCLLQVATESSAACIDPLSVTDFQPLLNLFADSNMLKILHACDQDMELFQHNFKCLPKPVFDTQLAAAVLGYANQIGYADLVQRLCGVRLEKKYTRTDWSRRPLSDGALDYAMDDVRYLISMAEKLQQSMQQLGRESWLEDEFEQLCQSEQYTVDADRLWKKLKGVQKLKSQALNRADQLCRWREQRAMQSNLPRRWIIKDEDLIDIARFNPQSLDELAKIGALSGEFIKRQGSSILEVLQHAASIPAEQYPKHDQIDRLNNQQQAQTDCLMAISRLSSEQNNIALASLVSKKELDQMVIGNRDLPVLKGWKKRLLGQQLLAFLEEETELSIRKGKLTISVTRQKN